MNEIDVEGEWLVLRQVLWKVPQQLVDKSQDLKAEKASTSSKKSWDITDSAPAPQQRGEVREGGREREMR